MRPLRQLGTAVLSALLLSAACAEGQESRGTLEGQVFVVTRGAENIRLGLVQVCLYPAEHLRRHFANKLEPFENSIAVWQLHAAAKRLFDESGLAYRNTKIAYDAAREQQPPLPQSYLDSLQVVLQHAHDLCLTRGNELTWVEKMDRSELPTIREALAGLGTPMFVTKTDADGAFEFRIPQDLEVALVAMAERRVTDSDTESYDWVVLTSLDGEPSRRVLLSNDNLLWDVVALHSLLADSPGAEPR